MWWAGSRALDMYVADGHAGVSRAGEVVLWQPCGNLLNAIETAIDAVASVSRGRRARRSAVNVWLSGKLARPFMLEPVQGIRRWSEVMSLAIASAPQATGLEGPCLAEVQEWEGSRPAVAIAMQENVRQSIQALASRNGLRIRSIQPWWQAAANASIDRASSVRLTALTDTESSVVLGNDGEHFCLATSYVPALDKEQARKLLARLAFSSNHDVTATASIHISGEGAEGAELPFGPQIRRSI